MEELWTCETKVSNLLLSESLSVLFSFIRSNPLYFFYLILFSPCLLKIVSFLSPLLFSTCLLSAAVFTSRQTIFSPELLRGLPASSIAAAVKLDSGEEEFMGFDDLGVGEFVFGISVMEIESSHDFSEVEEKSAQMENDDAVAVYEDVKLEKMETVNPCDESREERRSVNCSLNGEDETELGVIDDRNKIGAPISIDKFESFSDHNLSKEWRRTLGCMLLEDRHDGGGDPGDVMDSLWELQEAENNTPAEKKSKLSAEEDEEEDDGGGGVAVVCCLQGMKLSAGKMSLGVGRRKLGNITKAIKRYGWLQRHVQVNKKKVHANGDS